jgi:DNA segregation ATPase FtsK/SpoIIIE, S-DNA-T family
MARKKKNGNSDQGSFITPERKLEIIGVVIMSIAVLIALSIITYSPTDNMLIRNSSFSDFFRFDQGAALRIRNGLGIAGAHLSYFFVYILFGYHSVILAALTLLYGWFIFRHNDLSRLHGTALLYTCVMALLAAILGWITMVFETDTHSWSGFAGLSTARVLAYITGTVGSLIILASLSLIASLVIVDGNIQSSIDRLKGAIERFRDRREEKKAMKAADASRRKSEAAGKAAAATATTTGDPDPDNMTGDDGEELMVVRPSRGNVIEGTPGPKKYQLERENGKPSIDEILKKSKERDEYRHRQQIEEEEALNKLPPRAILEKPGTDEEADTIPADDEGPEISVFVGKQEEEADEKEFEKQQKAREIPVIKYRFPHPGLLDTPPNEGNEIDFDEINENKLIILDKLKRHNIEITAIDAIVGPTVTLYELQPSPDVKISRIESYANDLKMAMATHGLRIIAPIPGKSAVGIEVPNRKRETVYIKSVIYSKKFLETDMDLPVAFGKTIENEIFMLDLARLPHLLIAGATGSGKSVGINTVITCLLYKCHPENLKFVLIDPKKIELSLYRNIQNHFIATLPDAEEPIVTDTSQVLDVLNSVCKEMDERYELLKMGGVRDIKAYNAKMKDHQLEQELGHRHLPYIIVVIDELADLMITAGKSIEEPIARIAQLARAVGIHMVIATQRPSVNVITGTIKANFPARIAYQVASKIDSRTILDTMGADQLVGRGDMLFSSGGAGMVRVQNAFVSTEEVDRITAFIGNQLGYKKPYLLPRPDTDEGHTAGILDKSERDDLFEEAARVVVMHQQGSVSLLQRKLKLGYNRAGRIIDQLYAAGVVGPYQGSTAREVLVQDDDELRALLEDIDAE